MYGRNQVSIIFILTRVWCWSLLVKQLSSSNMLTKIYFWNNLISFCVKLKKASEIFVVLFSLARVFFWISQRVRKVNESSSFAHKIQIISWKLYIESLNQSLPCDFSSLHIELKLLQKLVMIHSKWSLEVLHAHVDTCPCHWIDCHDFMTLFIGRVPWISKVKSIVGLVDIKPFYWRAIIRVSRNNTVPTLSLLVKIDQKVILKNCFQRVNF